MQYKKETESNHHPCTSFKLNESLSVTPTWLLFSTTTSAGFVWASAAQRMMGKAGLMETILPTSTCLPYSRRDRVGSTSVWNPHTTRHWHWDTSVAVQLKNTVTFHRCSKVFGVDDGDVRELLASGHAALANNTSWGSSILMHNLFLYCGGTSWVVLTPPPYPMDVADEVFSKAGATRPMCLWWSVLPPCNSTDQHISGLGSIRRSS